MSTLADRILAYMTTPRPTEQIFRQQELATLVPSEALDQVLAELAKEHKIGSPAPGIWVPLVAYTTAYGCVQYTPPALLRDMAVALLRREGVPLCRSPQERDYYLYHATQGREGVGSVPTFQDIGVDQPVSLQLTWGQGHVQTVYQGKRTLPTESPAFTPEEILAPDALRHVAARAQTTPERLEKDIWVNRALRILGEAPNPPHGLYLFTGGTCLTKVWRLTPRFSEDIDLRFQRPVADKDKHTPEAVRRDVHDFLLDKVQQNLLPALPGGRLDHQASVYQSAASVQRVAVQYDSYYVPEPGRLKLDIMFTPGQVPFERRSVQAYPVPDPRQRNYHLAYLPCVPPWVTMTGKLHALVLMHPDADVDDMRHIVDLGAWLYSGIPNADYPYMVQQSLNEFVLHDLLDGLWDTLDALAAKPVYAQLYDEYVSRMFPGHRVQDAPDYQETLSAIRHLWCGMCDSDWHNPVYRMGIPDIAAYTQAASVPELTTPPTLTMPDVGDRTGSTHAQEE